MYLDEMEYSKDDVVVIYFFTPFYHAQILRAMTMLLVQRLGWGRMVRGSNPYREYRWFILDNVQNGSVAH
jgi:hypothetical protein